MRCFYSSVLLDSNTLFSLLMNWSLHWRKCYIGNCPILLAYRNAIPQPAAAGAAECAQPRVGLRSDPTPSRQGLAIHVAQLQVRAAPPRHQAEHDRQARLEGQHPVERFIWTLKNERNRLREWRKGSQARGDIADFIRYYNFERRHGKQQGCTPAEDRGLSYEISSGRSILFDC